MFSYLFTTTNSCSHVCYSLTVLFFLMAKIIFPCQVNLVIAPSSQGAKYLSSITIFMFKVVSFTQKLVS